MRLQIWTSVVHFFVMVFLGSEVNAQSVLTLSSHKMGSWKQNWLTEKDINPNGWKSEVSAKKWKNAILKTNSWLSCLQFPVINFYNKSKFFGLKHEAFFIKFSDFWANPDFTRGVNLGVPEVVKWPIHDSIQFFSSKYEYLGVKHKKVTNVRTPKNSK